MSELMTKHEMTEEDIKLQYITPAIERAGWNKLKQIKMEYNFTDGRVIVRGNVTARGKKKRTDYLLYYKPNIPLAIIEAKDNKHSVGAGMQQANKKRFSYRSAGSCKQNIIGLKQICRNIRIFDITKRDRTPCNSIFVDIAYTNHSDAPFLLCWCIVPVLDGFCD